MLLHPKLGNQENGLCLLSLDAGGTRGVSQLRILAELMHQLNFEAAAGQTLLPCDVFDMIGGSGGGGFIAILLVVLGLNAKQALSEFVKLSVNILEKQGLDPPARTEKLKAYINKLLKKHKVRGKTRLLDQNSRSKGCKLIVLISHKHHIGHSRILRNFDVRQEEALNLTIAEAMLATLASPSLFVPIPVFENGTTSDYISADLTISNPIRQIISEAYGAFGEDRRVACLLSIGCGHPGVVSAPDDSNLANWNQFLEKVVQDGEEKAEEIESQMGHLGLYHRFSVTRGLEGENEMTTSAIGDFIAHTMVYLSRAAVLRKLERCTESLVLRDGVALLEQLKHSGGRSVLPPALPLPTRTFVMRKKPWQFVEKAILGVGSSEEENVPRMLVVTGMGGCGKTQLILQFAHVNKDQFAATFFIDGSCVPRIRADTIRHVRSLGISHSQKGFEDCLRFLAQPCPGGRRLILYDNVDDPDIDLVPLLPLGNSCAIVVTSRNRSLGELCPEAHLELDTMSMDEAVDLFPLPSGPSTMITDHMREEASAISRELGCLPIALTQARSYMYQTQCSASKYHERLLNSRDKLLAKPVKHHRDMRYVSTYAAFDASFGLLPSRWRHLLRLLSCFHWSDFPLELVFLAAKYEFSDYRYTYSEHGHEYYIGRAILRAIFLQDGNWDIAELDEMIIRLQNHSLITLVPGIGTQLVQMHPVAHGWVKSSVPEKMMARYQSAAILLLALGSREEHTYCTQYLTSHVTHFSTVWDQLHANNAEAFGHILDDGGTFEGALQLRRRVVAALRCQAVPDSKAITNALWYLALSYCRLGRYKDAEPLQREALRLKTEILGERHPDTINASINLANTYCDLGRLKEAETLQKGVLKLRKEILGERHPDTIMASSNLAATYNDMGRLKEAEVLQEEVMELMKETLGERHPDTIKAASNLANTYCDLGRLKMAESLQEKVLGLRKEMLGECHPDTLSSTGNLALTYRDLGRLKEAEMLQDEVLRLWKEVLGERHPDTIIASGNLAATYCHVGRLTEAESLQEQVLKLRMEMLGERHPNTLKASSNLANTYYSLGRLEEARILQEKVLKLRNETLGERHPETIKSSNNLASTYCDLGRLKEAEVLQEEVLKLRKEVLGRLHPDTLRASANLANYYRSLGKFKDAETLQVETLGHAQRVLGDQHPCTAAFMLTLAEIYESLRKNKIDALKLLDTAESIFAEEFGKDHPRCLECQQVKTRVQALPDTRNPVTALTLDTKIAPRNDASSAQTMARPSRIPKPCSNTSRTPTKPRRNHQLINRRRYGIRSVPC